MSEKVFIVGALAENRDRLKRHKSFLNLGVGYASLDEALASAEAHYRAACPEETSLTFRVYRAEDGQSALLEVLDPGSVLGSLGFYKVVAMQARPRPRS